MTEGSTARLTRTAWVMVALLVPVALLNYLDRQMLATMKTSMVADIVEDVQAQTGDRAEGLLMTADSLPNRIVNSLSVVLPGLLLAWVGFPEKARPGPEAMAMMSQVGWVFLPLMVTISCLSIGTWTLYRIDKATHERNLLATT